jgi:hypothetical protein
MAVRMKMLFFWVVTPCILVVDTNVSEKHTVSIFSPEECTSLHGVTTQKNNIVNVITCQKLQNRK